MKKTILFLIFLVCNLFTEAQIRNVSITLQGNSTFMRSISHADPYYVYGDNNSGYGHIMTRESYISKGGLDLKFKLDYSLTSKLFFSSGVALNYYTFIRNIHHFAKSSSAQVNLDRLWLSPPGDKSAIYIQLPVLMGSSFLHDRLIVRAGASISFILDAYGYKLKHSNSSTKGPEPKTTQTSIYNSLLFNAVAESTYKISKKMGVELSFQKSFTTIYTEPNRIGGKTRYNILSIGLSYFLK